MREQAQKDYAELREKSLVKKAAEATLRERCACAAKPILWSKRGRRKLPKLDKQHAAPAPGGALLDRRILEPLHGAVLRGADALSRVPTTETRAEQVDAGTALQAHTRDLERA